MKRMNLRILAVMAIWAMASLPTMILAQNHSTMGQDTLAVVNGAPITRHHIEKEKRLLKAASALDAKGDLSDHGGVLESELLDLLIDRELIVQLAMDKEMKINARSVEETLAELKKRFSDAAGYEQYLLVIGMTEAQLTAHFRTGLIIKRFLQSEVIQNIRVSDNELKAFYLKHPEDFIRPSQVRALHLLVSATDEKQRREALLKIQAIELKLAQGADFAATALEESDCPSSARGGDLGYFTVNQVIAPVAEAAFTLEPGQISPILESSLGLHLIKVIDRKPPSRIAFKDVRAKIDRTIRRNKENRALARYMARLRKNAEIVRYSTTR